MLLNKIVKILSLILLLIVEISSSMAQDDCVDGSPLCGCMVTDACNFDPSALFNDDSCEYPDECGVCGGNGIPEFSEPGMAAYSFYRTHFGSGNISQYPNYASSESDLDEMTNPANPATSLLFEGIDEASILFDWTSFSTLNSAFGIDLPGSYVSWRFVTTFTPNQTGVYLFTIEGDDGRDLTIDGDNIASFYDGEAVQGLGNTAGSIELTEGVAVTLRARGQEWLGQEAMRVFWKRPSDTNWQQDFSEIGSEAFCDCDGNVLDECGVCNGPGAVYECGCSDIPEGECDCNGNILDALSICGGACELDENDNGVCDTLEIYGCMDSSSCNYNPFANYDSGDCDYTCYGCLDENACNYDIYATLNDGLCEYESCACPLDLNEDGIISVSDILILLGEFGCIVNCVNDLNGEGNGAVNIQDLLVILSVFNTVC
jgi:hypothetical protein